MFAAGDLVYSDTNEPVPNADVTYSTSCFEAPALHQFHVTPRFADLVADLGELAVSTTVTGNGTVAMVDVMVVNDGHEEGSMTAFSLAVNTRANGSLGIWFAPLAMHCDLQTADRRTLGYGVIHEDRIDFTGVNARVPGGSRAHFPVRCELLWPTTLAAAMSASYYEIRMGALSDSFRMSTTGDRGRIQGTTRLDDNRQSATPDAVTITLRPVTL